jgi:hypothetical protein
VMRSMRLMKVEIEVLTDSHDCETCGCSWAEGGVVYVDGVEVLVRKPSAYCYNSPSFSESDLLVMALTKLGHEVLVDGSRYQICSHDDEYHGYKLEDY